jgi:hypothetical protein
VTTSEAAKPAPAAAGHRLQDDRLGGAIASANLPRQLNPQQLAAPRRATLIGSDRCEAEGHTVRAYAPVLAMCRELVAAGYDPETPFEVYRGDTLCLKVRSIGEGARYTAKDSSAGTPVLRLYQEPVLGIARASPIAPNVLGAS